MSDVSRIASRFAAVAPALREGAQASGVDFGLLAATARRESAFDPSARAQTSSASGLFQFVDQTWLEVVRRHGERHGLKDLAAAITGPPGRARVEDPALRAQILALRTDPALSARMAGELFNDNRATLSGLIGRAPSTGELYAAHVLGAAGAAKLIKAAEAGAGDAAALFPQAAAANKGLFYGPDGAARSAAGLLAKLDLDPGGAPPAAGTPSPAAPAAQDAAQEAKAGAVARAALTAEFVAALLLLRPEPQDGEHAYRTLSSLR